MKLYEQLLGGKMVWDNTIVLLPKVDWMIDDTFEEWKELLDEKEA